MPSPAAEKAPRQRTWLSTLRSQGDLPDTQTRRFPSERFDLAMSRFGTMFFDDPVMVSANIGRALLLGGRRVMLVWPEAPAGTVTAHRR